MAKAVFERTKPHVNIGTIGHVDHGKTTLTAAIKSVLAIKYGGEAITYDQVAKASESAGRRDAKTRCNPRRGHHEEAGRAKRAHGPYMYCAHWLRLRTLFQNFPSRHPTQPAWFHMLAPATWNRSTLSSPGCRRRRSAADRIRRIAPD